MLRADLLINIKPKLNAVGNFNTQQFIAAHPINEWHLDFRQSLQREKKCRPSVDYNGSLYAFHYQPHTPHHQLLCWSQQYL